MGKYFWKQAEQSVLNSLTHREREIIQLEEPEFEKVSVDRLLHEMSFRQKLIEKDKGMWRITDLGRTLLGHSQHSE